MVSECHLHNPFDDLAVSAAYDSWFASPLGAAVDRLQRTLIYRLAQPQAGGNKPVLLVYADPRYPRRHRIDR